MQGLVTNLLTGKRNMDSRKIIMNFTVSPSLEDLEVIACNAIDNIPDELAGFLDAVGVVVEEFPDETLENELELDDPFDLVALYRSGKEISPGIEKKSANDDDILMIFRRPLLDMWCDTGEDLAALVHQVIIEELARNFDFSDDEIEDMARRHHQGML